MKITRSKRFLNLATLCLALLGTTLLTTQPVKAEGVQYSLESDVSTDSSEQSSSTGQTGKNAEEVQQTDENAEDDNIKKEYMTRVGLDNLDDLEHPDYKDRFQGYLNGYKEGLKGSTRPEPKDIQIPKGFEGDTGEYKDGYEEGFGEGRRKNYPVRAFLEEVWGFLTGIFHEWFDGAGSQ
ncbi:TPA: hypothetical protein ACQM8Z_000580 [Streptococcus pyogenes]|uniref:hypothetical protein n=1 Tax=Streptococcus pyogenes TaxID=1314 RepID=UPI000E013FF6|nr:hypothetical protein [Streptococcus pyogenes]SUO61901.1 hypothetical membrane associated protein [Streptococcus pyogenes]VGR11169.1 hypothetical membrane associated protein [Streptococcus pyogenes]VGV27293.1 Uncharacterised protein [Streptococcus pyogenes]VGW27748.1 Uncharacterised protein [Streptococcus pyogenes]VGX76350.1 Uncharacterised protein [Streptococcus pyogenes]